MRAAIFILLAAGLPALGHPQEKEGGYPDRTIELVVGFAAGGQTDRLARILAGHLAPIVGVPVVVQNRPGAGGTIAARSVAKAVPDGYTLFIGSIGSLAVAPLMKHDLGYDPASELVAITMLADFDQVLVVHPSVPVHSLVEFIEFAKLHPGAVTFASTGIGSASHLAGESLQREAHIEMLHVPYNGAARISRDLLAGDVLAAFAPVTSIVERVRAGRLRALASTGPFRNIEMPELPTMMESGYPNYSVTDWYALTAPSGTPPGILRFLNDKIVGILNNKTTGRQLALFGMRTVPTSTAEARAFIAAERERWGRVLLRRNVHPSHGTRSR